METGKKSHVVFELNNNVLYIYVIQTVGLHLEILSTHFHSCVVSVGMTTQRITVNFHTLQWAKLSPFAGLVLPPGPHVLTHLAPTEQC